MAKGKTYLFTVGYTESGVGVTRPNYPIKRLYKQTIDTQYPKFPDSFEQVSASLYWFPYQDFTPLDTDYIPYVVGDEYGWVDDQRVRPKYIAAPNPNSRKRSNYDTGTRIVFGGQVYEATRYYFYWSDTNFGTTKNPYTTDRVIKWRKVSDTSETWVQYWYHPLVRRFYVLENDEIIQDLPDTTLTTKWDGFTGDALELNLANFTAAQIRQLVSKGEAPPVAETFIDRLDQSILDLITSETTPLDELIRQRNRQTFGAPPDLFGNQFIQRSAFSVRTATVTTSVGAGGQESIAAPTFAIAQMRQQSSTSNGGAPTADETFDFEYRPNNVSYSNIGSNWTEIDRVNNSPVLDFKNFKLMKISFEFVVGDKTNLYSSCELQLAKLRKMASLPYPVTFVGFDKLFSDQDVYAPSNVGSGRWAIVDMSISSVFRTQPEPNGGTATGSIARATINMTIQEIPRDIGSLIKFPRLPFQPPPKTPTDGDEGDSGGCIRKFSELESIIGYTAAQGKRSLKDACSSSGGDTSKLDAAIAAAKQALSKKTTR